MKTQSEALLDAIQACGNARAKTDQCTERSGLYNFLSTEPVSLIVGLVVIQLNKQGYKIGPMGHSKTSKKPKNRRKINVRIEK